jgi:regulator of ribonuclease activity B
MGLFRKRRRDDQPVDPEERSPQLGLKYKDLALLGQLQQAGADLAQPRHVIYFSYAPSREVAQAMGVEAGDAGFTVELGEPLPDYPGDWPVRCEATIALLPEVVRGNTDFFEKLAARHAAEFDGWEAAAG